MRSGSDHLSTRRVIYSGNVQGVGFRWTARDIAREFPVTGYVRNLSNGTVELVAQGSPKHVRELLDAVSHRFRNNVSMSDEQVVELAEEFESFEIRH